jgi:hypothetical protein
MAKIRFCWTKGWYGRKGGMDERVVWTKGWCGRKGGGRWYVFQEYVAVFALPEHTEVWNNIFSALLHDISTRSRHVVEMLEMYDAT